MMMMYVLFCLGDRQPEDANVPPRRHIAHPRQQDKQNRVFLLVKPRGDSADVPELMLLCVPICASQCRSVGHYGSDLRPLGLMLLPPPPPPPPMMLFSWRHYLDAGHRIAMQVPRPLRGRAPGYSTLAARRRSRLTFERPVSFCADQRERTVLVV